VRVLGTVIAMVLAPAIIAWNVLVFNFVIVPIILMAFAFYPVRMCRAWVFIVCIATSLYGIALTCLMLGLAASSPQHRPYYAVTWNANNGQGTVCMCGCDFPVSFGVCMNLAIVGIGTALKSIFLALRCLKGLRRSQWANLLSVVFPVPLTVYTVDWRQSNGQPIKFRTEHLAVQEEVAFDPFAMMDEQLDSAFTTVNLQPDPVMTQTRTPSGSTRMKPTRRNIESPGMPNNFADRMQITDTEYIGCCGFPWPTGGKKGLYDEAVLYQTEQSDGDENDQPNGQGQVEKPPHDPEPDGQSDESVPQPKDSFREDSPQFHFLIQAPDDLEHASGDAHEEPPCDPQPNGRGTSSSLFPSQKPVP